MDVPVVSLAGRTALGRGGVSQATNLGVPELIAERADDYVRIAVDLANDLPRLAKRRRELRCRLQASPLMDGTRFARNHGADSSRRVPNLVQDGERRG
jgi:predicted O-linked N-acetylglucosamine transferase (SPINDLY family)